jgi:hypothetical protein
MEGDEEGRGQGPARYLEQEVASPGGHDSSCHLWIGSFGRWSQPSFFEAKASRRLKPTLQTRGNWQVVAGV